ncbi:MAG TPA: hypothetical protein QGI62_09565 [Anaerolineales bacterium]|nr:hypothetical protein [Anaerolineales bacterium]HJO34352.1 hypothetical protein [Anaerolineales bacterium]
MPQHVDFLAVTLGAEHVSAAAADHEHHAQNQSLHPPSSLAAVV